MSRFCLSATLPRAPLFTLSRERQQLLQGRPVQLVHQQLRVQAQERLVQQAEEQAPVLVLSHRPTHSWLDSQEAWEEWEVCQECTQAWAEWAAWVAWEAPR